ncbi:hypothetical protein [Naumannella huperziae]
MTRRYVRHLVLGLLAYAVLLATAMALLGQTSGVLRWVVMLLPLPALVAVAWAVIRWIREADELQGRIAVEGMAIGFAIGSLVTFGYGLLQIAGAPQVSWLLVWPVYAAGWLIGRFVAGRRY